MDAQNAENVPGMACAWADERMAAAIGLIDRADTRFEMILLGFTALGRLHRAEALRHVSSKDTGSAGT